MLSRKDGEASQDTQLELLLPRIIARREDFLQNWCILSEANVARTSVRTGGMNPAPHFFSASERSERLGCGRKPALGCFGVCAPQHDEHCFTACQDDEG